MTFDLPSGCYSTCPTGCLYLSPLSLHMPLSRVRRVLPLLRCPRRPFSTKPTTALTARSSAAAAALPGPGEAVGPSSPDLPFNLFITLATSGALIRCVLAGLPGRVRGAPFPLSRRRRCILTCRFASPNCPQPNLAGSCRLNHPLTRGSILHDAADI